MSFSSLNSETKKIVILKNTRNMDVRSTAGRLLFDRKSTAGYFYKSMRIFNL